MIVVINFPKWWPFSAIAMWPFVLIRPERQFDYALIAHEKVHLQRQLALWVLPWWVLYCCSQRFRVHEEVLAYAEQIRHGGSTIGLAANAIALRYRVPDYSYTDIAMLLANELKG